MPGESTFTIVSIWITKGIGNQKKRRKVNVVAVPSNGRKGKGQGRARSRGEGLHSLLSEGWKKGINGMGQAV